MRMCVWGGVEPATDYFDQESKRETRQTDNKVWELVARKKKVGQEPIFHDVGCKENC